VHAGEVRFEAGLFSREKVVFYYHCLEAKVEGVLEDLRHRGE
jgi:hypothetical protein